MIEYGLIGHPLSHSFSEDYFLEKFKKEKRLDCNYRLFDLDSIKKLPAIIEQNKNLVGLNVTIPYKESVLDYLDEIDPIAADIGAVNTIKIDLKTRKKKGCNTDYYGFKQSLKPFITTSHQRALVLGTGGASKAVYYVLKALNIDCLFVSRKPLATNQIAYDELNKYVIQHHQLIVNTTPVGMFPTVNDLPDIPYEYLTEQHLLYDLIYNPKETCFLQEGIKRNTTVINGLPMLIHQAEESWKIWNA